MESLAQVQATPEEVKQLTTISTVQTLGLKKLNEYKIEETKTLQNNTESSGQQKFSSIAGKILNTYHIIINI